MNVLIGCEESGIAREEFRKRGHNAWSCDLKPTRIPGQHWKCDIKELIEGLLEERSHFDLVILHPDCTALALSGNRWYGEGKPRHQERLDAIEWTVDLWNMAKKLSDRVALENPASVIFPYLRKIGAVVQFIQPWQFGHGETKKTGLALHGVNPLVPTHIVDGREHRIWKMAPSEHRKRDRAETFQGIAEAFATQWT